MPNTQIASLFPGLRVLIVEDLIALAIQYRTLAARLDVHVSTAGTLSEAMRQVPLGPWHAALIDLNLPDGSGFEVMQALLRAYPTCSVVVITGEESLDNAVRASKAGAFDFLQKPVEAERLLVTLRNALHASRMSQRVATLQTAAPTHFEQFIGQSAEMQAVYRMIETVAASNAPVCISGESGTGKELVALAIHTRSARRHKKLVTVNSAAIPRELIESELFGHVKGAFTGASADRPGVFQEADQGTLFLDEIAELDLGAQAKLLRVLQTGEVKRLGEDKTRIVDVRIVCATHRDLRARVRSGEFREDLFYRLYVVPIELPPLRSRGDDVLLIANELLLRYAKEDGKRFRSFSNDALTALRAYAWPGNVRELINVIRALVALNDAIEVQASMLPLELRQTSVLRLTPRQASVRALPNSLPTAPGDEVPWFAQTFESSGFQEPPALGPAASVAAQSAALTTPAPLVATAPVSLASFDRAKVRPLLEIEREVVDYALRAFGGNVAQAARALQVNPSTLYRKIQLWTAMGEVAQERTLVSARDPDINATALLAGIEMQQPGSAFNDVLGATRSYKGQCALVVDDQRVNQLLAKHLLQLLGFEVNVADDGEQAVLAVQAGRFDVVLMDLQMPTMDGWQATHLIRQWEQSQAKTRVPIIALTAHSESASRELDSSNGIDGYLTKPLTQLALQTALQATHLGLPAADGSPVNRQQLLGRLGQDEAALRDMVKAFSIDLRKCLKHTLEGVQSQDWASVCAQAHGLKGLLSSMTAEAAAADAHALELAARSGDAVGAKAAFSGLSASANLASDAVQSW